MGVLGIWVRVWFKKIQEFKRKLGLGFEGRKRVSVRIRVYKQTEMVTPFLCPLVGSKNLLKRKYV